MNTTAVTEKKPKSKALIRFQDCDPFGHLNNSQYIDYFMNAREDHLRDFYGLDIYKVMKESGFGWVVAQHQIVYLKPVNLMEEVMIQSSVIGFNSRHIQVELLMTDIKQQELKSILWTKFVSVDVKTGKRIDIPQDLRSMLSDVLVDDVDIKAGFENRVGQLLGK